MIAVIVLSSLIAILLVALAVWVVRRGSVCSSTDTRMIVMVQDESNNDAPKSSAVNAAGAANGATASFDAMDDTNPYEPPPDSRHVEPVSRPSKFGTPENLSNVV